MYHLSNRLVQIKLDTFEAAFNANQAWSRSHLTNARVSLWLDTGVRDNTRQDPIIIEIRTFCSTTLNFSDDLAKNFPERNYFSWTKKILDFHIPRNKSPTIVGLSGSGTFVSLLVISLGGAPRGWNFSSFSQKIVILLHPTLPYPCKLMMRSDF